MTILPTSCRHFLYGCRISCDHQIVAPATKISRARLSIPHSMLVSVALSLAVALQAMTPAHASYSTQGRFSVNTEGGSFITREDLPSTQLDISDSDTSVSGVGNTASAGYAVSITNVALSASASAQNALFAPGDYWTASGGADGLLYDDLRFTIPAGDYPAGLYVVARVHVEGSVAVSGEHATARHIYRIYFGSDGMLIVTDAPAPTVSTDIELTAALASPGATFINPVTFSRRFNASVETDVFAWGEVGQTSSSSVIAISVTCLVVPPNITWVADSGAFGAPDCSAVDSDSDGVIDDVDNCLLVPNVDQRDTNADDIGNICDPDIDNDCNVNFSDLNVYKSNFFAPGDLDTDNNGDGFTNFSDLNTVKGYFFGPPGPSATGCN